MEELFAETPKNDNDSRSNITDVTSDESEEDTDSEAEVDFGNVIPRKNGKKDFYDQLMNINWRELLENNSNGNMCLNHYKLFGDLTPNLYMRLLLIVTGELVKCVWQGNKKFYHVNYDLLDSLADKLVSIFGNIPKSTFFIHPRISLEPYPRGKLYDAYRRDTNELRLLGIKTKNTKRDDARPPKKRRKVDDSTDAEIFEAANSFEWLKEHPDSTDWHAIKYHWSNSYNNRMENWENLENSDCVFTEFPMLQQPNHGLRLLVMDYEILAETDVDAKQKWPQFSKKLLTLMKDKLKAPVFVQMLQCITDDSLIDKAAILFRLLPALIPMTWSIAHDLKTATNKKDWKPSIDEGMDGFVVHVQVRDNLEE
uniref:Uncharacterized protein n=1 Tax=Trichogramma kaykai TaxID=54128 RepID=A0ABD2WFG3_9HYME